MFFVNVRKDDRDCMIVLIKVIDITRGTFYKHDFELEFA